MKNKKPMNLSWQESEDLWAALASWEKHLDKKKNPITHKAIKRLIVRVRAHINKFK